MSTVVDTLKNPFGMARLLEGYSTIKRARDANLTDEQIRQVFPDTQKFDSKELDGFMAVGGALVRGGMLVLREVPSVESQNHLNEMSIMN
ncbi:hypothetical protein [Vibrio rotiferianus]|uniref:hypothetical protein n=1 Tax=Vibrio rotiferianus TaxID=190895 RepID=UPI000C474E65|nr:hypothetical protein [Vibrio rotiferianus]PIB16938.1 hypothetical protein B853_07697 [Vibrio rotiferianus CAIM 577 = LMG 21460]